jgi:hypothetical protein
MIMTSRQEMARETYAAGLAYGLDDCEARLQAAEEAGNYCCQELGSNSPRLQSGLMEKILERAGTHAVRKKYVNAEAMPRQRFRSFINTCQGFFPN